MKVQVFSGENGKVYCKQLNFINNYITYKDNVMIEVRFVRSLYINNYYFI